jgi:Ca2+-binding RTX toxin-like protein
MWYEGLEQRALLTAEHNGDGLTVTGTAGNDIIQIRTGKDETTGAAQIIVSESVRPAERGTKPAAPTVTRFDATKVKSVLVNAGAGDDAVALRGRRKTPFNLAATINGQDGNDRLTGGGGADAINGGLGNDRIEGGDGADVLHGDAGNDRVDGGRGADKLFGDDGNDFLLAADRGGVDTVDGGANDPVRSTGAHGDLVSYEADHGSIPGPTSYDFEAYLQETEFTHHPPYTSGVGEDLLTGIESVRAPKDATSHIVGEDGPNVLIGSSKIDVILGNGGNDLLFGLGSNDSLSGGDGPTRWPRHRPFMDAPSIRGDR